MALPAGGAVGEEAHGIDRLVGRARGHHDPAPLQQTARARAGSGIAVSPASARAAAATMSSGSAMRPGPNSPQAMTPSPGPTMRTPSPREDRAIAQRRGMQPHADVHRGREQDALVGGEQQRRGEVVGEALRHLGHEIGGGGRHEDEVGAARQFDMAHLGLIGQREQVVVDALARQAGDRQRRDELLGRGRHHGAHRDPALAQAADEVEGLVGRDAAAHDEQDATARHAARRRRLRHDRLCRHGSLMRPDAVVSADYNARSRRREAGLGETSQAASRRRRGSTARSRTRLITRQVGFVTGTAECPPARKKSLRRPESDAIVMSATFSLHALLGRFLPRLGPPFGAVFFFVRRGAGRRSVPHDRQVFEASIAFHGFTILHSV